MIKTSFKPYFDIDAEQVFWICKHNLEPLSKTIKTMISELKG